MDKALESGERILVCLSSSPSNQKVIIAASKMAEAFHAVLTAIYVRPTDYEDMSAEDKQRLHDNITFAEENGASVSTMIGDDVPFQIAEYAHISGTTKIVVGRSGAKRRHFWSKAPLTEQLIMYVPDVDVYIIPDSTANLKEENNRFFQSSQIRLTWKDFILSILILLVSTGVGFAFTRSGFSESNIIIVYILGVLMIAVVTVSPIYSGVSSLASVLLFNYLFVEPKLSLKTYEPEYVITFGIMLVSSLITVSLANRLKENARQSSREAFRAKVLFDTNQLLQKAVSADDVIRITARQMVTLLNRDVIVYPINEKGELGDRIKMEAAREDGSSLSPDDRETEIVHWVFSNQQVAGPRSGEYPDARSAYHPISINGFCYGVIGIYLNGEELEAFEYSVFASILGECAMALESLRNAMEKEQAAIAVRNEQLRSNLLRSISHDIRTPLTSISGNASNLLSHYEQLDRETLEQVFSDIYDDSEWLIDLVENLLSISRIENGQMGLNLSLNILDDVIEDALKHIDKKASEHEIRVEESQEILIARMDARLIAQVLINLINNAIKNTQVGSHILIKSEKTDPYIFVTVSDDGPGIPDDVKTNIFEMFYTMQGEVTDGRRGLGLGLALCRSIIEAHGGTITLTDNDPTGCCFRFSLPSEEVIVNE